MHHQNRTHPSPVEWKSIQENLVIILLLIELPSNTTQVQIKKAPRPTRSDFNFGKSIHHFIFAKALRMINSHVASCLKQKTPRPNRTKVNAGRSIHHFLFNPSPSSTTREQPLHPRREDKNNCNGDLPRCHFNLSITLFKLALYGCLKRSLSLLTFLVLYPSPLLLFSNAHTG